MEMIVLGAMGATLTLSIALGIVLLVAISNGID
jgi:hypothetical protein